MTPIPAIPVGLGDKVFPILKIAMLADTLRQRGVSAEQLLAGTQIRPHDLTSTATRISPGQLLQCYRNAIRLAADDPYFAYRLGLRCRASVEGVFGFALLSAPTAQDAIRFALSHQQLSSPLAEIGFRLEGENCVWTISPIYIGETEPDLYRFLVEFQFGAHTVLHQDVLGRPFAAAELHVTYDPLPAEDLAARAQIFGCPTVFGQRENRFIYAKSWLSLAPQLGFSLTHLSLVEWCDQLLEELGHRLGIVGEIRKALLRNLGRPIVFDKIAAQVKHSPRTLRRRLNETGTSFRQIADELRMQIALKYLRETDLTNEDIATALGFSDAANFRRSFRRWTKATPRQFRHRNKIAE